MYVPSLGRFLQVDPVEGATPARVADDGATPTFTDSEGIIKEGVNRLTGPVDSDLRGNSAGIGNDGSDIEGYSVYLFTFLPFSSIITL